jgi:hypothetical protein
MPGGGALTFHLGTAAPEDHIIIALDAEPRGPQPRATHSSIDLKLLEYFARDAQGRLASVITDGRLSRVEIRLPACATTTA